MEPRVTPIFGNPGRVREKLIRVGGVLARVTRRSFTALE